MMDTIGKWEREQGVNFLKKIGIKTGQTVLDFGTGVGHYCIPAAIVVGETGLIYAVDKEQRELDEVKRKAKQLNLKNIKIMRSSGSVAFIFEDETIDVVLLYDVLHYLKKIERARLYSEIHRVLKHDGILSVYPKHVIGDSPLDHFKQLNADDVKKEILAFNFQFQRKKCDTISHNDFINQGCVYNFIKGI